MLVLLRFTNEIPSVEDDDKLPLIIPPFHYVLRVVGIMQHATLNRGRYACRDAVASEEKAWRPKHSLEAAPKHAVKFPWL